MRTSLGWAPEIPDHWEVVPLNAVAKMGTGHTPDRSKPEYWENCTIPWVTLTDASRHGDSIAPMTDTYQHISDVGMRNSAATLHPAGTVCLSRTASVGHSAVMGVPMATTQDFATWTCGPQLDSSYLLLVLRAMEPEWERLAYGSTHRTIYMPDIESIRIPLPPIDDQLAIVAQIHSEVERLDQLSSLQARVRSSAHYRRQARLDQVVDDLASKYGSVPLRRMIKSIEQGSSPQCFDSAAPYESWGVLKVSSVKNGQFVESENKQLPPGSSPEYRYEIRDGDLLVTRANTPGLVGATAVARKPRPRLMLSDKIFRLDAASALTRDFIELVSASTRIRALCMQVAHGTSASMANLKADEVKRWPIPSVSPLVQRNALSEIAEERSISNTLIGAIEQQLSLLAERRRSLISTAVTGQIEVGTARGASR